MNKTPMSFFIIVIVLILACNFGLYSCTNSNCISRGGHTEIVWGGHGGWTCEGAQR